jgi:hypothetical protein
LLKRALNVMGTVVLGTLFAPVMGVIWLSEAVYNGLIQARLLSNLWAFAAMFLLALVCFGAAYSVEHLYLQAVLNQLGAAIILAIFIIVSTTRFRSSNWREEIKLERAGLVQLSDGSIRKKAEDKTPHGLSIAFQVAFVIAGIAAWALGGVLATTFWQSLLFAIGAGLFLYVAIDRYVVQLMKTNIYNYLLAVQRMESERQEGLLHRAERTHDYPWQALEDLQALSEASPGFQLNILGMVEAPDWDALKASIEAEKAAVGAETPATSTPAPPVA